MQVAAIQTAVRGEFSGRLHRRAGRSVRGTALSHALLQGARNFLQSFVDSVTMFIHDLMQSLSFFVALRSQIFKKLDQAVQLPVYAHSRQVSRQHIHVPDFPGSLPDAGELFEQPFFLALCIQSGGLQLNLKTPHTSPESVNFFWSRVPRQLLDQISELADVFSNSVYI